MSSKEVFSDGELVYYSIHNSIIKLTNTVPNKLGLYEAELYRKGLLLTTSHIRPDFIAKYNNSSGIHRACMNTYLRTARRAKRHSLVAKKPTLSLPTPKDTPNRATTDMSSDRETTTEPEVDLEAAWKAIQDMCKGTR